MSVHSDFHEMVSNASTEVARALRADCNDPRVEAEQMRFAASRARLLAAVCDEFADHLERKVGSKGGRQG
jgi:hypothetical protein